MSNTTSFAAVPQTCALTAPVFDLAVWRERNGATSQYVASGLGVDIRVTGPIAGMAPSNHNSITQPMGATPAEAVGAHSTKQAAPPRGRYR